MKKINTSPISGTQELLPNIQASFDRLKHTIEATYKAHGFLNIETPMLERTEILLAKAGAETEKQIYEVKKTGEAAEEKATQALRFDHTVPLARYVVEHENELVFPFKAMQAGENFRGERAQKGRFREFYQCDVDVIGRGELPLFYDADVIVTLMDTYKALGLTTPVMARISNRMILAGLIEGLNLQEKAKEIPSIIDHAEKVPPEKTEQNLVEIGLSEAQKERILAFIDISGDASLVVDRVRALGVENVTLEAGLSEITEVARLLDAAGRTEYVIDLKIVRGLDYYTGTVFEFALPEYPEIGSIGGGGRYANLAEYFTEQKFPGVGGSIGLNRLFYIVQEKGLLAAEAGRPVDYAILPLSENELGLALKVARELQEKGNTASVLFSNKKLGERMNQATKIAMKAVILGENEVKTGAYAVKELSAGSGVGAGKGAGGEKGLE